MNTENNTEITFTQVKGRHLHRMAPPSWMHKDLFPIWRAAVEVYVEEQGGSAENKMAYPTTIGIMKGLLKKAGHGDVVISTKTK